MSIPAVFSEIVMILVYFCRLLISFGNRIKWINFVTQIQGECWMMVVSNMDTFNFSSKIFLIFWSVGPPYPCPSDVLDMGTSRKMKGRSKFVFALQFESLHAILDFSTILS